jgi:hypothetical protein
VIAGTKRWSAATVSNTIQRIVAVGSAWKIAASHRRGPIDDDKKLGQDCYVRDADGHALAYVCLEQEPNARQFEISPAIHL